MIAIPYSYESPDSYVDTNVKGTLNILQAARALKTGKVLITSTSEVYGSADYVPIDESHPFKAQSPYSATKIGADRWRNHFTGVFLFLFQLCGRLIPMAQDNLPGQSFPQLSASFWRERKTSIWEVLPPPEILIM